jgi:hypothetical protein
MEELWTDIDHTLIEMLMKEAPMDLHIWIRENPKAFHTIVVGAIKDPNIIAITVQTMNMILMKCHLLGL